MGDEDNLGYKPRPYKGKVDPLLRRLKQIYGTPDASGEKKKDSGPPKEPAELGVPLPATIEMPADTTRSILQIICDTYSTPYNPLTLAQLLEKRKRAKKGQDLSTPKHVAAYVLRKVTGRSFPKIGEILGGRHHTVIMYSCRWVEEKMAEDETFKRRVEDLEAQARERYQRNG